MQTIKRFLQDEAGATAIEYGLVASGVALAVFAALGGLSAAMNAVLTTLSASLK